MTNKRSPYLKASDKKMASKIDTSNPGIVAYVLALLVIGAIIGGLILLNIEIWSSIF